MLTYLLTPASIYYRALAAAAPQKRRIKKGMGEENALAFLWKFKHIYIHSNVYMRINPMEYRAGSFSLALIPLCL